MLRCMNIRIRLIFETINSKANEKQIESTLVVLTYRSFRLIAITTMRK